MMTGLESQLSHRGPFWALTLLGSIGLSFDLQKRADTALPFLLVTVTATTRMESTLVKI